MRTSMFWVAGMVACAPPPEVDLGAAEEPVIEILYPVTNTTDLGLDEEGRLHMVVVVDINGFEFLPAYSDDPEVDREGQGHWHLLINGTLKSAAQELFVEFVSEPNEYTPGQLVGIRAELVTNTHNPLTQPSQVVDTVEITVAGE